MVRNKETYEQALHFRQRGFTLEEIARICDVSKGTVSKWLKNNPFSAQVTTKNKHRAGIENAKRLKLMNKARGKERALRYKEVALAAEVEFKHYKKDPAFVAGLATYATAGDITDLRVIRLTSSRLSVHRLFITFAVNYLGVPKSKVRLWLLLYPAHNEEVAMRKWHKATAIPFAQFHHSQVVKTHTATPLHDGVGNTIIGSTVLKRKLIRWIELLQTELK